MPEPNQIMELQKAFYDLYNKLNDAYWAASTVEAKDQIHGAKDLVDQVLDIIDRSDLESDNDAIGKLTDSLRLSIDDLKELQSQLAAIVHSVAVATSAIQAINTAINVAGKLATAV